MISGLLSAELSATCNALGYSSGSTYYTDPYVKETITDLIRFLRRDDEDHTIRRHLGCAKILQTDLLPILIHHSEKEELFDVLLRLLVNLTNPALLIYQEELPADRTARHYFLQLVSQLQSYKEAFTQQKVWEILTKKLGDLLQIEYHERDEDQSRTMERILILARNVLQVPADRDLEKRPDNDASVHDQVLWSLHQAGMVDLFLYIASTDNEQQYYMHILEIVSLMLREQNPAMLASSALQRSVEEKERDEKELLEIRRKEIMEKQHKMKKYAGSRHSRFGGTYVIKDVKSISENDMIFHKPLTKAVNLNFDFEKQRAKVPRNKLALSYQNSERRSAFSVRLFLKEFCVEFLNGAYNPLMYKVRENLVRKVGQANDETYFFWAMKFFMEFNRLYKFQVKLISETMHQQIFHFVQTTMENWLELMVTEKKKIPVLSRRIHQALKAYQELLMTLQEMDRSEDKSVRDSSRVIKSNVFYQSEYRELVVFLFNVFTEVKFSKSYLKDLVETTHVFLKMLQHFCTKTNNLMVQGKPKNKPKTKKKKATKKSANTPSAADLESIWDEVGPELSAVLQFPGNIPADIVPFDAASDLSMADQKVEAMKKIQAELKQGNYEQAVGLLRASREVWPENDSFGHANMAAEDEFLAMREIFMTNLNLPAPVETAGAEGEEGNSEESDDEEGARDIVVPEYSFNLKEFIGRFACSKVLQPVCLLLESYETNSQFTNHCIMKLLHRVAWDCKLPAMLFQATVFRTFQRVLKSPSSQHKEIYKFAIFIMRKFAEMSKTNPKIYMELLFWKSQKDAYELEVGYGNVETKTHSAKNVWKEEQEDELRRLAAEYERDLPETDAVGWIMKNMIDQTRSRRAVQKKLKELYLVVGNMKEKPSKEFSEEEISELKALFEEYKSSDDPMTSILERLSTKRSRRAVVEKLLELELIKDKKEMKKKRPKKSSGKSSSNDWGRRSDDESIYDSWSDEDGGTNESSKKKKAPIQRFGQPSVAQMCCNLRKAVDAGLQEPLEWLKTSLQEVLEDLPEADDDDEGTALLPLNPACVQAMDNPFFLQLLDIFSIDKPTDQEVYWRIPGRWKAEDLNKRIKLIQDAFEGKLPEIHPDNVEEMAQLPGIPLSSRASPPKNRRQKKKSNKSRGNKIRGSDEESKRASSDSSSNDDTSSQRSRNINGHSPRRDSSSETSDDDDEPKITSTQKKRKPSNTSESDSDKENNASVSPVKSKNKSEKVAKNKQSMKRRVTIDSESDNEVVTSTQKSGQTKTANNESRKMLDSSDSEDDQRSNSSRVTKRSIKTKRKRISIDSESDDNTSVNKSRTVESQSNTENPKEVLKKKRFSLDSDSSSDDEKVNDQNSSTMSNKASRKRLSIESDDDDSDNDENTSKNSTKITATSPSQRSSRANSGSPRKGRSSSSESDSGKNTTMNSTRTTVASPSQRSSRSKSPSPRKRRSSSSESDNGKNTTMNSTRTTVASPSQRSSQSKSPSPRKRRSSSSESDNGKNTTMNSTKTTVASPSQSNSQNSNKSPSSRKRLNSSSDSDDNQSVKMNSTTKTESHLKKKKRLSIDSDSDDN